LLSNIDVGSVGWTMEVASTAIFLNRDWTPSKNEQAEKRIVDVSPELKELNRHKSIIDLVVADTYDEHSFHQIGKKKSQLDTINDYLNSLKRKEIKNK
jgi:SNF2 family DNA or RNA helicase